MNKRTVVLIALPTVEELEVIAAQLAERGIDEEDPRFDEEFSSAAMGVIMAKMQEVKP